MKDQGGYGHFGVFRRTMITIKPIYYNGGNINKVIDIENVKSYKSKRNLK